MRIIATFLALAVIAAPLAGSAQDNPPPPAAVADALAVKACLDAAAAARTRPDACKDLIAAPCLADPAVVTTAAMIGCVAREAAAWDIILNEDYQRLLPRLDDEQRAALLAAQRLWVQFRDADCTFPHVLIRGTIASVLGGQCVAERTMRRVLTLREYLVLTDPI